MEKLGVNTDPEDKTAGESSPTTPTCPVCQQPLRPTDEVGVRICPTHGSAPFEAR